VGNRSFQGMIGILFASGFYAGYEPLTEKEYPPVSFFSLGAPINAAHQLLSYLSYD
jgi:hypothetical protein